MAAADATPFNRTSMESKPTLGVSLDELLAAFNRTSMESKPELIPASEMMHGFQLLIEPVWNRNSGDAVHACQLV